MRACTEYIATVPPARTIIHTSQASRGRLGCRSDASSLARRARSRVPNVDTAGAELRGSALVTSTDDVGAIAHARLGDHDARRRRITLDLASEVRDVNAKILLRAPELPTPHRIEDLLMGKRAPTRVDEGVEDLPFDGREVNLASVAVDATRYRVYCE